jgi:hypothetical protein
MTATVAEVMVTTLKASGVSGEGSELIGLTRTSLRELEVE